MSNKDKGNDAFRQKNFDEAINFYTEAIAENSQDHTIYGNRAAAYHNQRNWDAAMNDAEECIKIKPDWGKGY
jgi:stress-induced-phosphoprotein 1